LLLCYPSVFFLPLLLRMGVAINRKRSESSSRKWREAERRKSESEWCGMWAPPASDGVIRPAVRGTATAARRLPWSRTTGMASISLFFFFVGGGGGRRRRRRRRRSWGGSGFRPWPIYSGRSHRGLAGRRWRGETSQSVKNDSVDDMWAREAG
jgi:hypothetical protein